MPDAKTAGTFLDSVRDLYDNYVMAVGRVVYSWNKLQAVLGDLFLAVTKTEHAMGQAIWHSITSDSAQRNILRASVKASLDPFFATDRCPVREDILWILEIADHIASERNDAVHVPFDISIVESQLAVVPISYLGNPKYHKFDQVAVLEGFAYCEQCADRLRFFVERALSACQNGRFDAWPGRPEIATRRSRERGRKKPRVTVKDKQIRSSVSTP